MQTVTVDLESHQRMKDRIEQLEALVTDAREMLAVVKLIVPANDKGRLQKWLDRAKQI